jgi:hypothetical protein
MSTSNKNAEARARGLVIGLDGFALQLSDGRQISVSYACYPRLAAATLLQRTHFEVCAGGRMLHWPEIDEDIEVQHILKGLTPIKVDCQTASAVAEARPTYKARHHGMRQAVNNEHC